MREKLSTDKFVCKGKAYESVFRMLRGLNLGRGTYYADREFCGASRQTVG